VNTFTALSLVNQALRNLGEQALTTWPDPTNPRALLASEFYLQVRDTLLGEHYWNFATVRTTLRPEATPAATLTPAATTGAGILFTASTSGIFPLDAVGQRLAGVGVPGVATISALVASTPAAALTPGPGAAQPGTLAVPFTAAASVFTAADVGAFLERLDGAGLATITAVGSPTQVFGTIREGFEPLETLPVGQWRLVATNRVLADITAAFSGAVIPAGAWTLSTAAPAWGFAYRFPVPDDYLAMQRTQDAIRYQREGDYFLSDEPTLPLTYTSTAPDVTRWPTFFVHAFVAALTAAFAEQTTGQQAKHQLWLQLAEGRLKRAKMHDGQEGSAPQIQTPVLIRARHGAWGGWYAGGRRG
jgi:hypothetical protein